MLLKRKRKSAQVLAQPTPFLTEGKTFIGERLSATGKIRGAEDLVIEGTLKGRIEIERCNVTIGPKGLVEAEILAANVTHAGRLKGSIQASDRVQISKDAEFVGEIRCKRISVEDGALLKAVIEMEPEPQEEDLPVSEYAGESGFHVASKPEYKSSAFEPAGKRRK
jgi:cytoskeletal protein CcmA (bactofilin family)